MLPRDMVNEFMDLCQLIDQNKLAKVTEDQEKGTGNKPIKIEEFARKYNRDFRPWK
jgi:hypothetical protein